MKEQVINALEMVRPTLQRDGGDVEFVSVTDKGLVEVRLLGACGSCPMSTMTLENFVETTLKEQVAGVTEVVSV